MRLPLLLVVACSSSPSPPPPPVAACTRPRVRLAQLPGAEAPLLAAAVEPKPGSPLAICLVLARTHADLDHLIDRHEDPPVARPLDDPDAILQPIVDACRDVVPAALAAATTRADACSPYRTARPEDPLAMLDLAKAAIVVARAAARAGDRPAAVAILVDAATALDDLARGGVALDLAYPAATGRRLIAGQLALIAPPDTDLTALVAAEPPFASYLPEAHCATTRDCLDAIAARNDAALTKRARNLAGATAAIAELPALFALRRDGCDAHPPAHPLVELARTADTMMVATPGWVFGATTGVVRYTVTCR